MKIVNVGSINIDHVYGVSHFVRPGETQDSRSYAVYAGGKGANQSIALARAGAEVMHVGKIGADGLWLKEKLQQNGIDTSLVVSVEGVATGHAVIQVNEAGENAIIIHGGANRTFSEGDFDAILSCTVPGDYLLVQNEINDVASLIQKASNKELTVVFNPAPMTDAVKTFPLECVDIFIINETEGAALTGESDPQTIVEDLLSRYPHSHIVLTLGKEGVLYAAAGQRVHIAAHQVKAIDTTGAGDTFIGYFLAMLLKGDEIKKALETASEAAALCVTRKGAADSIPYLSELS